MNRIRELRKNLNMTQKELAKLLQIADSTLSYWDMGRYEPDNDTLLKLSRFFKVPIDYILGGDFTKWNVGTDGSLYSNIEETHSIDSGMIVSEAEVVYKIIKPTLKQSELFNRDEFGDLSKDEIDLLAEYALFIKSRRKSDK